MCSRLGRRTLAIHANEWLGGPFAAFLSRWSGPQTGEGLNVRVTARQVWCRKLGQLILCNIGHDGSGSSRAWFVQSVQVSIGRPIGAPRRPALPCPGPWALGLGFLAALPS